MDYKQKYEQALENIKKIKAANKDNKELVDFIEYNYPELIESEDERIRKALILHIKYKVSVISGWKKEELIAWLEKQGMKESKKTSIWKMKYIDAEKLNDKIKSIDTKKLPCFNTRKEK